MEMMIKNWIILGVAAAVLLTYALTPGSISAEYGKSRQQAASQANACGNGDFGYASYASYASNVFCQDTGSQVQGEENAAALTSQQS